MWYCRHVLEYSIIGNSLYLWNKYRKTICTTGDSGHKIHSILIYIFKFLINFHKLGNFQAQFVRTRDHTISSDFSSGCAPYKQSRLKVSTIVNFISDITHRMKIERKFMAYISYLVKRLFFTVNPIYRVFVRKLLFRTDIKTNNISL